MIRLIHKFCYSHTTLKIAKTLQMSKKSIESILVLLLCPCFVPTLPILWAAGGTMFSIHLPVCVCSRGILCLDCHPLLVWHLQLFVAEIVMVICTCSKRKPRGSGTSSFHVKRPSFHQPTVSKHWSQLICSSTTTRFPLWQISQMQN